MSDWGGENLRLDVRWQFGFPPKGNANFAWVQHFHPPPRVPRHGRLRPRERQHVLQPMFQGFVNFTCALLLMKEVWG
jgi:hypothetical protein